MERVTAVETPDAVQLTNARFRISQASLARRKVWRRIQEFLMCRVRGCDCATLRDLTARDLSYFERSSAHVAAWSAAAALADWPRYQAASRHIRGQIVACVNTEQALLYPMLHRYR